MSFKILVCENDKTARDFIKIKIDSLIDNSLHFMYCNADIESVAGHVFVHKPHIVYFDLKYTRPQDVLVYDHLLTAVKPRPKIVVALADAQMELLQRFVELGIASFILKPLKNDAVKVSFDTVIRQLMDEDDVMNENEMLIYLRSNRSDIQICQKDILIIESNRNICYLTLKDGSTKTINESMAAITQKIQLKQLVKIDKSTIINTGRILFLDSDRYNKSCKLKLVNGELISKPISKAGMTRLTKIKNNDRIKGQNTILN